MREVTSTTSMFELEASCDMCRSSDEGITKSSVYVMSPTTLAAIAPATEDAPTALTMLGLLRFRVVSKTLVPAIFNAFIDVVEQLFPVKSYLSTTLPLSLKLSAVGCMELDNHFF